MKLILRSWYAVVILIMVNGLLAVSCAQLGLLPAKSFDQKWAYAMGLNTGIRNASVGAAQSGVISKSELQTIVDLNDRARAVLDVADDTHSKDQKGAEDKLALATAILESARDYVTKRGVRVEEPRQLPQRKQLSQPAAKKG